MGECAAVSWGERGGTCGEKWQDEGCEESLTRQRRARGCRDVVYLLFPSRIPSHIPSPSPVLVLVLSTLARALPSHTPGRGHNLEDHGHTPEGRVRSLEGRVRNLCDHGRSLSDPVHTLVRAQMEVVGEYAFVLGKYRRWEVKVHS